LKDRPLQCDLSRVVCYIQSIVLPKARYGDVSPATSDDIQCYMLQSRWRGLIYGASELELYTASCDLHDRSCMCMAEIHPLAVS